MLELLIEVPSKTFKYLDFIPFSLAIAPSFALYYSL